MSADPNATAYVETIFAESLSLLQEIRDAVVAHGANATGEPAGLDATARLLRMRDLSRLTNRMTAAVSILLLFKAFDNDQGAQIDKPEARLDALHAEIVAPPDAGPPAPPSPFLSALLERAEATMAETEAVCGLFRRLYLPGPRCGAPP